MFLSSKRLIFGVRLARFVQTSRQYTSSVVISQIVCYKDKQFACSRYRLMNSVKPVFQNSDRSASSLSKMSSTDNSDRLVWIDCEMSGLDADKCHLLEVACIITDGDLNIIAEGPTIIIHQSDEVLDVMDDWCTNQHSKSGLTQRVRDSQVSLVDAEDELLCFVTTHTSAGKCVLAGNSVHADKRFLDKYMSRLMNHLHYRIVDVSTVKELCRRWYPVEFQQAPIKSCTHRALSDIKESIQELVYYRTVIFKQNDS